MKIYPIFWFFFCVHQTTIFVYNITVVNRSYIIGVGCAALPTSISFRDRRAGVDLWWGGVM